ncbi:hypothetical protein LOC68_22525 [Blastopirellula sp. JC732]|uniref:Uncharacterized protein n=1 Tax=Blastopirellula sediminis TaxID=2894196 RepID=A0A9X1MPX2_9BACT|nr:hypothetical protein [Blastopirellula sediminis]MCC9605522.1 hypothetical protein [Blastopirellula sediminis]MCC9631178.1 hypothetical protein [Blastopirellula sediminis]
METIRGGEGWRNYLATAPLQSAIACQGLEAPSLATRRLLNEIALRFEETARNPNYRTVTASWEFQTLRNGLPEYAEDRVARQKARVAASVVRLVDALERTKQAAGWMKYLQLDDLQKIAQSKEELSPADHDILRKIAERMKEVDEDSKYHVISSMTGFAATRGALGKLTVLPADAPDPKSAQGVLKLADSDSAQGVKRLTDSKSAQGVVRLVDRKTIREKIEGLLGDLDKEHRERVQEVIEGLFRDSSQAEEVILLQFQEEPKPAETTLMPLENEPEPAKTTLLPLEANRTDKNGSREDDKD